MSNNYKVVGLRNEIFSTQSVSGHNCDFQYEDGEKTKHIIQAIRESDGSLCEIILYETEGECGSGWTTASFGHMEIEPVEHFGHSHYKCFPPIDITINSDYEAENEVFSYSDDGGDGYYPSGSVSVNMDVFKVMQDNREKDRRPIWLFHGDSTSGKSYLANLVNTKNVYETDKNKELPKNLGTYDIIVIGNKYKFSVEQIQEQIGDDYSLVDVSFKILN